MLYFLGSSVEKSRSSTLTKGWSSDYGLSDDQQSPTQDHDPTSDGFEVGVEPTFGPCRIASILAREDLKIVCLQFQIPSEFQLELTTLDDMVAKPHPGQIGLYKKYLRFGLRLPFHPFVIAFFRAFRLFLVR